MRHGVLTVARWDDIEQLDDGVSSGMLMSAVRAPSQADVKHVRERNVSMFYITR